VVSQQARDIPQNPIDITSSHLGGAHMLFNCATVAWLPSHCRDFIGELDNEALDLVKQVASRDSPSPRLAHRDANRFRQSEHAASIHKPNG